MSAKDHIDKFGIFGAAFAALCCLGIPAILSVVTAIGLGFLIHDAILLPLLIVALIVALWGLASGWHRHRRAAPLVLGGTAATTLVVFSYVHPSTLLTFLAIAGLIAASAMNVVLLRRPHLIRQREK